MGYFLINVYVPCALLVIISWVGFWINREATSDRMTLGEFDSWGVGLTNQTVNLIPKSVG